MRYCPYCRRINSGRPLICRFCGRTWYIRLCNRGHSNPSGSIRCGECGSLDLTDPAGKMPWFLIGLKILVWLLIGLFIYSLVAGFCNFLKGAQGAQFVSFIVFLFLLFIGFQFALSLLPKAIGTVVRRIEKNILKVFGLAVRWVLKKVWEIIK